MRHGACQVPRCGTGGIHWHYGTCQNCYGSGRNKILGPTKRDFCQRLCSINSETWPNSGRQGGQFGEFSQCWPQWVLDLRRHFSALSANDILGVGSFSSVPLVETKTVCLCWCQLDRAFNRNGRFVLSCLGSMKSLNRSVYTMWVGWKSDQMIRQ